MLSIVSDHEYRSPAHPLAYQACLYICLTFLGLSVFSLSHARHLQRKANIFTLHTQRSVTCHATQEVKFFYFLRERNDVTFATVLFHWFIQLCASFGIPQQHQQQLPHPSAASVSGRGHFSNPITFIHVTYACGNLNAAMLRCVMFTLRCVFSVNRPLQH